LGLRASCSHWSASFLLLIHHILIGQLSSSPAHSSHSHWPAFFFPCSFITFSLASFLLPLLINHILTGQLSSSPAHSSHSHWPAFFFPSSFITFSLVSFLLSLLIHHILIGQLSSSPVLIYHILIGHWSAFLYCCSSSVLIGQLSSTATNHPFPLVTLFFL
jgi:hypothetical protein